MAADTEGQESSSVSRGSAFHDGRVPVGAPAARPAVDDVSDTPGFAALRYPALKKAA
jgi:hypothetical protein